MGAQQRGTVMQVQFCQSHLLHHRDSRNLAAEVMLMAYTDGLPLEPDCTGIGYHSMKRPIDSIPENAPVCTHRMTVCILDL